MKIRNYVSKNRPTSGAGVHTSKSGKYAPRCKDKNKFKRELSKLIS